MKKRIFNIIWVIAVIVAIGVLVYSIIMLNSSYKEYKEVTDTNNDIISTYIKTDSENNTDNEFKIDWEALLRANSNIVAWIRIPDTTVNYPIIQGKNNNQYLRKNIYGNYSLGGTIFVDSATVSPFENMNTVVYGHNLGNGAMFSCLKKYSSDYYASQHQTVYIYLPDGSVKRYKVFSFCTVNANNSDIYNTDVENLSEYYNVIKNYNKLSIVHNIKDTNPIITLSTCTNKNKQERYVVQAYLDF